jgi:hypothetical protein
VPTFEVLVNGARACRASIDPDGGLHAIVSWRGSPRRGCEAALQLSISGVDGFTEESIRWPAPELRIGDEVTIRVTDAANGEAPVERVAFDPEELLQQQQEYVRQMAARWGWEIRTEPGAAADRPRD